MSSIINKIAHALAPPTNPAHSTQDPSLNQQSTSTSRDPVDGHLVGKAAADAVRAAETHKTTSPHSENHKNKWNLNNTSGYNNDSQPMVQNNLQSHLPGQNLSNPGVFNGNAGMNDLGNSKTNLAGGAAGKTGAAAALFNNVMNTGENGPTSTGSNVPAMPVVQHHPAPTATLASTTPKHTTVHNTSPAPVIPPRPTTTGLTESNRDVISNSHAQPLEHTIQRNILVAATEVPEVHVKPVVMPHVQMKQVDTSLPIHNESVPVLPKLQAIKVNSTFSSNSAHNFNAPEGSSKMSDLLSKLNNTASEVDNFAKERQDNISAEAQSAIAKVLGATEANQKALVLDCNKRSDEIDNTYKQQLQLYVTGLDKIRANSLATLEKEFETRQNELLTQAKANIDSINQEANRKKLEVLQEAQRQSMSKISSITDNVAQLALQDATKRLNSTITTTITTNTKGITEQPGAVNNNEFNKHNNEIVNDSNKAALTTGTEPRTSTARPLV